MVSQETPYLLSYKTLFSTKHYLGVFIRKIFYSYIFTIHRYIFFTKNIVFKKKHQL